MIQEEFQNHWVNWSIDIESLPRYKKS